LSGTNREVKADDDMEDSASGFEECK